MKPNYRNHTQNAWVAQAKKETLFCHNLVYEGDLYGSFNGVHFITEAKATTEGVYPSMLVLNNGSKWVRICPAKISAFLLDAIHAKRVRVYRVKTRAEQIAEVKKRKADMIYKRAFDDNCNSAIRRFKGKGQGHCSTPVPLPEEYRIASHEIYGGQIDLNGKIRFMDNKMSQYMDGNTTEGYRPLEPVFPVKSGKH